MDYEVLLLPNRKAPVVTLQVWYKVGSGNESPGQSGLAHLTEHLMFRGTQKYGPKQFSRLVQKNGGQDNAFTGRDYTAYFENMASDRLDIALNLESDRMTGLLVDDDKFFTERKVVQEERRLRVKDDPSASLFEEVIGTAFKSHPYQRPITGWMEDLEGLLPSDFLSFYRKYYQPANATLIVVGDLDQGQPFTLDRKDLRPDSKRGSTLDRLLLKNRLRKRINGLFFAGKPSCLLSSWPITSHPSPILILSLWKSCPKSWPEEKVPGCMKKWSTRSRRPWRPERIIPFHSKDPFLFFFYAQAMPGHTPDQIEERLFQELEDWEKIPPTREEIERAKNQIEAAFIFAQDSIFYQANLLGKYQTLGNWKDLNVFLPGIRAVQQPDLLRVYQTYFKGRNKTVGILIPINQPMSNRQ